MLMSLRWQYKATNISVDGWGQLKRLLRVEDGRLMNLDGNVFESIIDLELVLSVKDMNEGYIGGLL